ncbi:MAG TPA: hypothetical protein VHD61_00700 [Lacunisphaera sp.]|nr:hypothetical protein [Lacunisphaera sp.]
MPALVQVAILVILTAGAGYWIWRVGRRPDPFRAVTWLWCGLAGFGLVFLLLQALAYVDLPLRRTAPWAFAVAVAGAGLLARAAWRARRTLSRRRRRETGLLLAAGVAAGLLHSASMAGLGSDRFIGLAQIDQVNYVTSAQFLANEPYSTDLHHIGLRPWLWMPLRWKQERLTQSVVLGTVAVLARSDAQRAWGATAVFFTGLLGTALAAMWRVAGRRPVPAATLGFVGAAIPGVTYVFLIGFFSQLAVLFVFPALVAICWSGALPRRIAAVLAACLLGYLAGTYPDFWLIGAAVMGGGMLCWRLRFWPRVGWAAATSLLSLLLTGVYATMILRPVFHRVAATINWRLRLSGFVPAGIGWRGWGWNFLGGEASWLAAAGGLAAAGVALGLALEPSHRRWRWLAALAGPLALAAYLYLSPTVPVYPIFKLLVTFAPIAAGLAAIGWWGAARRFGQTSGRVATAVLLGAGALVAWAGLGGHLDLVRQSLGANRPTLDRLWAARDRVEHRRASYVVEDANALTGAWLAYFARASDVYYDLPLLADARIPTESAPFRRIPAGVPLEWLDLDRTGPAPAPEPSPALALPGARSVFETAQQPVRVLGRDTEIEVTRFVPAGTPARELALEFGFTPLPGVGPCALELVDAAGSATPVRQPSGARIMSVRLQAAAGRNVLRLHVRPMAEAAGSAGAGKDLGLLQALSLERPENAAR